MKGLVIFFYLLLFCAGCASLSSDNNNQQVPLVGDKAAAVIIDDLTAVLAQLMDPLDVTVQFRVPQTAYGRAVVDELRSRSFGMQRVSDDQGVRFLEYSESVSTGSDKAKQFEYKIALGSVSVERVYEFKKGRIFPHAPMVVRGSRSSAALETELFVESGSDLGYTHQIDYRERDMEEIRVPRVSLVTGELVSEIASSTLDLPEEVGINATNTETNNIYYTNESNFSKITRNYREIHRDIIMFADDSMRLGREGKKQVRDVMTRFDKDRDFINLIGCSQGVTKNALGNEGLALGRSKRVFEEFVALGAPRASLLDEGCWAPEASQARYPGRAVVVILKRRKS